MPAFAPLLGACRTSNGFNLSATMYDDGERYLIVACTVITEVPEAVGPCPVALMAKASLPLYLALALYS